MWQPVNVNDLCACGGGIKYPITTCIHPMFYDILFGFVDIFCFILRNTAQDILEKALDILEIALNSSA